MSMKAAEVCKWDSVSLKKLLILQEGECEKDCYLIGSVVSIGINGDCCGLQREQTTVGSSGIVVETSTAR
jgi:hypothetical protein